MYDEDVERFTEVSIADSDGDVICKRVNHEGYTADKFLSDFIVPLMIASGWMEKSINDAICDLAEEIQIANSIDTRESDLKKEN